MLSLSNPFYNTIITFVLVMTLIYIIKPETLYDKHKKEFRQFGINNGKTLMPIYVLAILMAIILYTLFNQIAKITSRMQYSLDGLDL